MKALLQLSVSVIFIFDVSTSQTGISGSFRLSSVTTNLSHVGGFVEVNLDNVWLKVCVEGDVSLSSYINPACRKLGYSDEGQYHKDSALL